MTFLILSLNEKSSLNDLHINVYNQYVTSAKEIMMKLRVDVLFLGFFFGLNVFHQEVWHFTQNATQLSADSSTNGNSAPPKEDDAAAFESFSLSGSLTTPLFTCSNKCKQFESFNFHANTMHADR